MITSGDVTAIGTAGALIFTVLCAIIKGIVDGAIAKALQKQQEWLLKEFRNVRTWQDNHVKDSHNGGGRRIQG